MPVLRVLLAAVLALMLTACSSDDNDDHQAFLGGIDGVARVAWVPWADNDPGEDDRYLQVTLAGGLSDEQVRAVVEEIKDHYDDEDAADPGTLQVVFDSFSAGIYPRQSGVGNPDPDFERALWLRADGRAESYGPGPHFHPGTYLSRSGTRPLVIAPAAEVAQLALDYDAAVPTTDEVRRSHMVGSADGTMRVIWEQSEGLHRALDRDQLAVFAALQADRPGTTGWYDGQESSAGVHFDPTGLSWAELRDHGEQLVAGLPIREVGWGPLRAPTVAALVRQLRRPAVRERVVALSRIPGVREYDRVRVAVTDRSSYDAVRRLLRRDGDRITRIALVRGTSPYIDHDVEPVFEEPAAPGADVEALHHVALDVA